MRLTRYSNYVVYLRDEGVQKLYEVQDGINCTRTCIRDISNEESN